MQLTPFARSPRSDHLSSFCVDQLAKQMGLNTWKYESTHRMFASNKNEFLIVFLDSVRVEHFSFILVVFSAEKTEIFTVQSSVMNSIKQMLKETGFNVKRVRNNKPELFSELCTFEHNFSLLPKSLAISVLYIKRSQQHKEQWFSNRADKKFLSFLQHLGESSTSYDLSESAKSKRTVYKLNWNGLVNVVFHPASLLNSDDQRGLIGNNPSTIVYLQEGAKFELDFCNSLGKVSQSWCVVQPEKALYILEFFSREFYSENLLPREPTIPINIKTTIDLCLERCFNTEKALRKEGPYKHMYHIPRQAVFEAIEEKYGRLRK